ncbi:bifunctional diguanylate cyclase/phosphodiesterase [Marinomonas pollencensis]|uniref:Diguanylate cyclase/phosphodiesterase n=1 Tax=Marinomonas pollencensis TaxID=491954 RepID=A0A3E0DPR1_9GAMM|nr:EAL domain-containing protein [Marinomonas pollencensis]REG84175.1 diguanylate cyclase/phosphodiesterase [Marinomonas pollencensis]
MTLFRQLMMTIVVIFSVILVVVMGINFNTTKGYLINQLESTTQDSATSLSMSVSDFMAAQDYASVDSSINAVFDSGYFSEVRIHVYATDKDIIRSNPMKINGVPQWFIKLISFDVPQANAVISNGWNELGQVYITGSAGYGYYQLWSATRDLLLSFVIIGVFTILFGSIALRYLFKPLAEVEKQAEAIQQRQFIRMEKLPKTRELKSVVQSMNRLTEKLEKDFDAEAETVQWLQAKAFKDPVSGLGNRHFFESQAKSYFSSSDRTMDGLMLVNLSDLGKLNNERGFEAADMFIRASAQIMTEKVNSVASSVSVARLSGADFIILIPNIDQARLQKVVNDILEGLMTLIPNQVSYGEAVANIGAVALSGNVSRSSAMAQADAALREAKASGPNTSRVFDAITGQEMAIGRLAWKEILEKAILDKAFLLRKQKVVFFESDSNVMHEEVFASLEHDGKQYHAGYFIGLAEQFDLGDQLDKVIIQRVIEFISRRKEIVKTPLAINLAASAYAKEAFMTWLDQTLQGLDHTLRSQLAFEVTEQSVLGAEEQVLRLSQMLKKHGVSFGVDNVGKQFTTFHYLQQLMPDYVKVDPSYTKMATGKESESFFMHILCKMFSSLNIQVIATGIESEQQLSRLAKFDIAAGQGFVVARAQDM